MTETSDGVFQCSICGDIQDTNPPQELPFDEPLTDDDSGLITGCFDSPTITHIWNYITKYDHIDCYIDIDLLGNK
jgi:hypothetical protein